MTNYSKEYAIYYRTIGLTFEEAYLAIFGTAPTNTTKGN
jgi:hypothetical protein